MKLSIPYQSVSELELDADEICQHQLEDVPTSGPPQRNMTRHINCGKTVRSTNTFTTRPTTAWSPSRQSIHGWTLLEWLTKYTVISSTYIHRCCLFNWIGKTTLHHTWIPVINTRLSQAKVKYYLYVSGQAIIWKRKSINKKIHRNCLLNYIVKTTQLLQVTNFPQLSPLDLPTDLDTYLDMKIVAWIFRHCTQIYKLFIVMMILLLKVYYFIRTIHNESIMIICVIRNINSYPTWTTVQSG